MEEEQKEEKEKEETVNCSNCGNLIYKNELCNCQKTEDELEFINKLRKNDTSK